ncbi:MAG: phosphatase PAP2 family protein [Geodermatophilaceae bacterium]|nr:phosphatase PAP2 family protein [Geodermatophilaceae bacterium]
MGMGALGILGSRGPRREEWSRATATVFLAHGSAVVIKRIVRRPRPDDPRIRVLVGTPSRLSFPSAHVSSTTAAALTYGPLIGAGQTGQASVIALMAASRLVLGVHFPSDVAVGALSGWAMAVSLRRLRT